MKHKKECHRASGGPMPPPGGFKKGGHVHCKERPMKSVSEGEARSFKGVSEESAKRFEGKRCHF